MKKLVLVFATLTIFFNQSFAQYPIQDHWYDNPLGFEPLKLHTSMGFLVPAVAVGACALLTHRHPELSERLSVYNESGFSWGYKYPHTFLAQNNTGVNYFLRNFMSVGAEFCLYFPSDQFNHTVGTAVRPFARFYPVNRNGRKLYFESGGGLVYFVNKFPVATDEDNRTGTQLNGTTKYGIGGEVKLTPSTCLMAGVRHIHVSNGNTKGVERNPSHDSNGFFIGFSIKL